MAYIVHHLVLSPRVPANTVGGGGDGVADLQGLGAAASRQGGIDRLQFRRLTDDRTMPPTMPHTREGSALTNIEKDIVHVDASFEPLMPKFLANRQADVSVLQVALAALDFDTLRMVSHNLKGVGGSYGFDRISEIAALIEQAAKASDASTIERELPGLKAYLDRVEIAYE
jgi:HPt (histidine-containing phosphotransfer) domain-containing protein